MPKVLMKRTRMNKIVVWKVGREHINCVCVGGGVGLGRGVMRKQNVYQNEVIYRVVDQKH